MTLQSLDLQDVVPAVRVPSARCVSCGGRPAHRVHLTEPLVSSVVVGCCRSCAPALTEAIDVACKGNRRLVAVWTGWTL